MEQQSWREVIVHKDVAASVDALLRGHTPVVELRTRDEQDRVHVQRVITPAIESPAWGGGPGYDSRNGRRGGNEPSPNGGPGSRRGKLLADPRYAREEPDEDFWEEALQAAVDLEAEEPTGTAGASGTHNSPAKRKVRIYPFGVSRDRLEQSARRMRVPVEISTDQAQADAVITSRSYYRRQSERLRGTEGERKPVYILRTNTVAQMQQCLARIFEQRQSAQQLSGGVHIGDADNPAMDAMQEAEDAIHQLLNVGTGQMDLTPQNAYIRRLQHRVAERYNLESRSHGKEPNRRVQIYAR